MKLKMFCFSAACEVVLQPFVAQPKTNVYKFARETWPAAGANSPLRRNWLSLSELGIDSWTRSFSAVRALGVLLSLRPAQSRRGDWERHERDIRNKD
jgi:hypothetical protein